MFYVSNNRMLVEMTRKQAEKATAKGDTLDQITWDRAHAWVKSGRTHSTALWVNQDGQIRRAGG
jgi:hypothetical protein